MASTGGGWAQLRQQARSLETQTESLFHTYSQFASMQNVPQKPSEEEQRTETSLQNILEQREALIAQLTRLLDSEATLTASALKQNNLARHREILHDHRRELSRLRTLISDGRAKANLLHTVRSDIASYRTNQNNPNSDPNALEADYMLDERGRVDNSNGMMDSVLAQAYAVNESFGLQRETLQSINRRIVGVAAQVPGINGLIGRIGAKKRRDGIILGSFIAFCCLMLLYFR